MRRFWLNSSALTFYFGEYQFWETCICMLALDFLTTRTFFRLSIFSRRSTDKTVAKQHPYWSKFFSLWLPEKPPNDPMIQGVLMAMWRSFSAVIIWIRFIVRCYGCSWSSSSLIGAHHHSLVLHHHSLVLIITHWCYCCCKKPVIHETQWHTRYSPFCCHISLHHWKQHIFSISSTT